MRTNTAVVLLGCVLFAFNGEASAATFDILGTFLPGIGTKGVIVSNDGNTVLCTNGDRDPPFVWQKSLGITQTFPPADRFFLPFGMSGDGNVIVGTQGFNSTDYDASYDGRVAVGTNGSEPYLRDENGITLLGHLPGGTMYGAALAVSNDGTTAVGISPVADGYEPFRWTADTGMTSLGLFPGVSYTYGRATDVSADGSVVVGDSAYPEWSDRQAFRWTEASGLQGLGAFPAAGRRGSWASAISADGSIAVGLSLIDGFYKQAAFIWDEVHGMRNLAQILTTEYGVDLTDLQLSGATDVSANGRVIVGMALRSGESGAVDTVAWRVELGQVPEPSCVLLCLSGAAVLRRIRRR